MQSTDNAISGRIFCVQAVALGWLGGGISAPTAPVASAPQVSARGCELQVPTPVDSHGKYPCDSASALIKSAIGYDRRFEYADGCPNHYVYGITHRQTMAIAEALMV